MKKLLLVLAMSLVCLSHGAQAGEIGVSSKEHSRVFALVMEGQDLSDEEAQDLATIVADAEDSLDARLKLIGYYDNQRSREGREARQEQMFWVAENAPKSCIRKSCKTILRPGLPATTR